MITVHKYPIPHIVGSHRVEMPRMCELLHVRAQGDAICIWARVDTEDTLVSRFFWVVETGKEVPPYVTYIGTAHFELVEWGPYVLHVFEGEANETA